MAEPLEIITQATPNPNALKFTLNRVVASQGTTYRLPAAPGSGQRSAAQAGDAASAEAAWAKHVLGLGGVTQIFALNNFISVNKAPDAEWSVLGPQVEQVLREAFA